PVGAHDPLCLRLRALGLCRGSPGDGSGLGSLEQPPVDDHRLVRHWRRTWLISSRWAAASFSLAPLAAPAAWYWAGGTSFRKTSNSPGCSTAPKRSRAGRSGWPLVALRSLASTPRPTSRPNFAPTEPPNRATPITSGSPEMILPIGGSPLADWSSGRGA